MTALLLADWLAEPPEESELQSVALQDALERRQNALAMLSRLLKKYPDTVASITRNIK